MRPSAPLFAILSVLLPSVAAMPTNTQIYLADIFHPPTMFIIGYLPGEDICQKAEKITQDKPFSLGGTDGLVLKTYWNDAKLLKDGRDFATCSIGPDSVIVERCAVGRRERLSGTVRKTWTCWVIGDGKERAAGEIPPGEEGGSGTQPGPNRAYWES